MATPIVTANSWNSRPMMPPMSSTGMKTAVSDNVIDKIGFTILSMTLSLTAVFIPVLLMGGIIGRLFHEFAVTIGVAIDRKSVVQGKKVCQESSARLLGRE